MVRGLTAYFWHFSFGRLGEACSASSKSKGATSGVWTASAEGLGTGSSYSSGPALRGALRGRGTPHRTWQGLRLDRHTGMPR